MKKFFFYFLMFFCLLWENTYAEAEAIRSVRLLNSDWKFILKDEQQAFKSDYNDSSWRTLDVPHDWAFENGYSKDGAQRENGGYAIGPVSFQKHARIVRQIRFTD